MTACMAVGPKRDAMATTAVCMYEPAEACARPLMITNAKKTPGERVMYVERVSSSTSAVNQDVDKKTLGDAVA